MVKIIEGHNSESTVNDRIIYQTIGDIKDFLSFSKEKEKENIKKYNFEAISPLSIKSTGTLPENDKVGSYSKTSGVNVPQNEDNSLTNHTSTLLSMIRNEDFEPGYATGSERFVKSFLEKDLVSTMVWVNTIFNEYYYSDVKVVVGILHILSHFDYKAVSPFGPTIAAAALLNKEIEVREQAIRAYENWGDPSSLSILKGIDCKEEWLQEYVNQIISDLEEENG